MRHSLRGLTALWQSEEGVSSVEFALAATVLVLLLAPVVDLGQAFSQQVRVEQAVQAGAQYGAMKPWSSSSATEITNAVTSAANLSGLTVATPVQSCGCPSGTAVTAASCGSTCSDGTAAGYYVTIAAQLPYTPTMPYSVLGSSATLRAQAVVRIR